MIKFFVGIGVVIFTTYFGRFLAKKYRIKKQFFFEMDRFNNCLLEELAYTKRPFEEFYQRNAFQGEFGMLIQEVLQNRAQRKKTGISTANYSFLNKDELGFISEYFQAVGRGDSSAQKVYFHSAKNRLESLKIEGEKNDKKYTELYTKLGFLAGLAILIVLA
jgi:stage III sporulation protein AB